MRTAERREHERVDPEQQLREQGGRRPKHPEPQQRPRPLQRRSLSPDGQPRRHLQQHRLPAMDEQPTPHVVRQPITLGRRTLENL